MIKFISRPRDFGGKKPASPCLALPCPASPAGGRRVGGGWATGGETDISMGFTSRLRGRGFILLIFVIWRINLEFIAWIGEKLLPLREGFLGPVLWANFDGVHYLSIAKNGYFQYQQAFFPLFPLFIRYLSKIFVGNFLITSLFTVYGSFFILFILFSRLMRLDFEKNVVKWCLVFLLFFPTAFYFGSVYTESFFLMLILGSFYAARRKKWFLTGILGGLASATRLVGICLLPALIWEWWEQRKLKMKNEKFKMTNKNLNLPDSLAIWKLANKQSSPPRCAEHSSDGGGITTGLTLEKFIRLPPRRTGAKSGKLYKLDFLWLLLIPSGLFSYMFYLWKSFGDPLYFFHAQPFFGAQRSGSEIILLPQVIWRYLKIFATVSPKTYHFWPAVWEMVSLVIGYWLLVIGWKKRVRMSYLIFSFLVITLPTLTGTLSSMPRYILVAFPMYLVLAQIENKTFKYFLLGISYLLLAIFTILFTRGYWVA